MVPVFFYLFATLALAGAAFILFTRNVMRAAFALMLTLLSVAALYVLAAAELLAVAQLMVYVGGVLILIIFGVMFTSELKGEPVRTGHHYRGLATVTGLGVAGLLLYVIYTAEFTRLPWLQKALAKGQVITQAGVEATGQGLSTHYVLPFETVGLLLLVALVGTAFVAGRKI